MSSFLDSMELQGIYLDKSNKLNIGFTYKGITFKQKSSFKVSEGENILFQHEEVLHLNESQTKTLCPFCQKNVSHLAPCLPFNESELQNVVVEEALKKIEQSA